MEENPVIYPDTGQEQEYIHLIKGEDKYIWAQSYASVPGRLAQGIETRVKDSNNPHPPKLKSHLKQRKSHMDR